MKISLVNNYPLNTGFGNYAFEIYNELSNKRRIGHVFLNFTWVRLRQEKCEKRESIRKSRKKTL